VIATLSERLRGWFDARKRKRLADYMATLEGLTLDLQDGRITVDATFGGPPVRLFAAAMVAWFKETGGKNYVTCELRDTKTREKYEITMQRAAGTTPAQRLSEMELMLTASNEEIARLESQLEAAGLGKPAYHQPPYVDGYFGER
jgi:hypothetical protein